MAFEIVKPDEIEKRSFAIITELLGDRRFPPAHESIVKRVIHTTADFEYADSLLFSEGAVESARAALAGGAAIVTDTEMARAGVNKKAAAALGGEVFCYMSDEAVAAEAKKRGVTRAAVCMERACTVGKPLILAIGNAPTALVRLYELITEGRIKPELVIGVPVGFVNVVEAKELIMTAGVPYIVSKGRKGGSNVAAAICNALLYGIGDRSEG